MTRLREALADPGSRLTATFVLVPRVEIIEALAAVGFDAVILDLEHGPFTIHELPALIAAGQGRGLFTVVRVAEASGPAIGSVLDAGADGVVVPHVSSPEQAAQVVGWGRFPPEGSRSVNPYVRSARYDAGGGYLNSENGGVAILVMVEGKDGLAAAADIAAVPGIDGVFVGPVDLSAALGVPGEPEHPTVVARIRDLLGEIGAAGVASGIYAPTPDNAQLWRDMGVRLVALSADMAMAVHGFRTFIDALSDPRRAPG